MSQGLLDLVKLKFDQLGVGIAFAVVLDEDLASFFFMTLCNEPSR